MAQKVQNSSGYLLFSGAILLITFILNLNVASLIGIPDNLNTILVLLLGVVFVFAQGSKALGWKNIILFALCAVLISYVSEVIGVATGLVFGPYYYTDHLGPKILGVPPMIQAGYLAMGYASFMIARLILGVTSQSIKGWSMLVVALLGSFIMVSWDVVLDPYQATAAGDWIWPTGGEHFGIGMHNYFGWFGTIFLYMIVYLLIAARVPEKGDKVLQKSKYFLSQPVLYYLSYALGIILVPWIGGVMYPYVQARNYNAPLQTLTYSISLIGTFVMGTPVVAALARLFVEPQKS